MARIIEPLVVQNINKDVAPNGLDYAGRRVINPVRDVLNGRYLSSEGTEERQVENIKGNSVAYNTLLSSPSVTGRNKTIGAFENPKNGNIIYCVYNTDGNHRIIQYDPISGVASVLINSINLAFQNNTRYLITGVSMVGDIVVLTDNINPQRYFNVTRTYSSPNDFNVSLMKIGPRNKPLFTDKSSDTAQLVNRISDNSFQFSFRYIYWDNETSVLSPYSKLLIADAKGIDTIFSTIRNRCLISHAVDAEVIPVLKRVELLFRVGNNPDWRVWKKIEGASIISTISEYFYNTTPGETVALSDSSKIFDLIPNKSKALTVFRNRIFLNVSEDGINVPAATISATRSSSVSSTGADLDPYIKKNGTYGVGLVEYDKLGRATGVIAKAFVSGDVLKTIPFLSAFFFGTGRVFQESTYNTKANRIDVTVGGLGVPSGRYSIVLTGELQYEKYFQAPAKILWYIREKGTVNPIASNEQFEYLGKIFTDVQGQVRSQSDFSYLYIRLPTNIPFTPDNTYYVKILNGNTGLTRVEKVIDVFDGDMLVVGNFGITNWRDTTLASSSLFIEVYKLKNEQSLFYYEVAGPFDINSEGVFSTTIINAIQGDTYYRGGNIFYSPTNSNLRVSLVRRLPKEFVVFLSSITFTALQFEQPTPVYTKQSGISKTQNLQPGSNDTDYTADYTKSAWSQGRTFVEATAEVLNRPSAIRFSDPYIEGSQVNGLNSFPVGNEYNKIGEDSSPITKLIAVGNILLAVHERNITSLYVGEGVVKTGDTGFLSQTDAVVGDDRKMIGNMGSYHPESVQEVDGMAFGFDIFLGVVWRYTVEGVFAVSNYGMKNYFRDRAIAYLQYKDTIAFVSGVDKYHKEYLITMPNVWATKQSNSAAFAASGGAAQTYSIPITPADYTIGEVYQAVVKFTKQSGASADDTIAFTILQGGVNIDINTTTIVVTTSVVGSAQEIAIEFVYTGVSSLAIQVTGISVDLNINTRIEERTIKGETWAFNYAEKVWCQRYSFVPEYFVRSGNQLFSFKYGNLWKHNQSATCNNFYGHQYKRQITWACNPQPGKVKTWSAGHIAGESIAADPAGTTRVMEFSNDQGQASYTPAKEFEKREGVYYGPILRDTNTNPLLIAAGRLALRDGKDMRSKSLEVTLNNDSTGRGLLQKVNIIGEYSEFSV